MNNKKILTIKDAAEEMKVSLRTVRRWIKSGKLKVSKMGHRTYRILEEDLIEFIKDHRVK